MGLESAALVLVPKLLPTRVKGAVRLILQLPPSLLCSPSARCLSPTAAETAWQGPGKESLKGSPPAALSAWSVPMGSTVMKQVKQQTLVDTLQYLQYHLRALGLAKSLEGLG